MTRRAIFGAAGFIVAAVAVWWLLFVAVPRWYRGGDTTGAPTAPPAAATPDAAAQRRITATLYFVGPDGLSLVPAQREVPFGEPVVEQARRIIETQLAVSAAPLLSAIPAGTTLRALYISERGDAFVDLSADVTAKHTGGSMDEILAVYTIVNALTVNLPAITRVQILVDGKEVDTLAGHVDLRNPLSKNLAWVTTENPS
ncbi:MAG: GerMN domain-containing protein [Acidobacteriota bacterium]|nr:GerMN domain-containing protein [Acidobacteriota bacterium]